MVRSLWIGTLAAALSCSAPGWSQVLQQDRWIMVREGNKPPVKCRVISSTKQKDGTTVCKAQTASGEIITLLEEAAPASMPANGSMQVATTQLPCPTPPNGPLPPAHSGFVDTPPPASPPRLEPVPQATTRPAVVQAKPQPPKPARPTLLGRFFGSSPEPEKVATRKEALKTPSLAAALPESSSSHPQLPLAHGSTEDPLNRPELYTKTPATALAGTAPATKEPGLLDRLVGSSLPPPKESTPAEKVVTTRRPVLAAPGTVAGSIPPAQGPSLWARLRGQTAGASTPNPGSPRALFGSRTAGDPRTGMPPGMGSVAAANDAMVATQSQAGMRMVRTPDGMSAMMPEEMVPPGANSIPVSASNAFTLTMPGNGMQGMPQVAMQPPMVDYRGVPDGAANAFTMNASSRPIPADMGPQPQVPNAFLMDGMGGAYARPPMAMAAYQQAPGYGAYPGQPVMAMQPPTGQVLGMLRGSLLPSERERAAEALSRMDWRFAPEAVAALVVTAQSDPAPMVRVGCLRALARMKVNTQPVYQAIHDLKIDKDVRVRQEAEQTLAAMSAH